MFWWRRKHIILKNTLTFCAIYFAETIWQTALRYRWAIDVKGTIMEFLLQLLHAVPGTFERTVSLGAIVYQHEHYHLRKKINTSVIVSISAFLPTMTSRKSFVVSSSRNRNLELTGMTHQWLVARDPTRARAPSPRSPHSLPGYTRRWESGPTSLPEVISWGPKDEYAVAKCQTW